MAAAAAAQRPIYTVIGGPNGSGKSTLAEHAEAWGFSLGPFINPDVIAKALPPETAARELVAGKEALRQSAACLASGRSFSRESTLTSNEIMRSMKDAKTAGFSVHLAFVAVVSIEESLARVRHRVERGGHDIPEHVQRRRFDKSLSNAAVAATLVDRMTVFENPRNGGHRLLAIVESGTVIRRTDGSPAWLNGVLHGLRRAPGVAER